MKKRQQWIAIVVRKKIQTSKKWRANTYTKVDDNEGCDYAVKRSEKEMDESLRKKLIRMFVKEDVRDLIDRNIKDPIG